MLVEADSVEPAKLPRANRIDLIVWRENALPCVSIKDKKTDYRVDEPEWDEHQHPEQQQVPAALDADPEGAAVDPDRAEAAGLREWPRQEGPSLSPAWGPAIFNHLFRVTRLGLWWDTNW